MIKYLPLKKIKKYKKFIVFKLKKNVMDGTDKVDGAHNPCHQHYTNITLFLRYISFKFTKLLKDFFRFQSVWQSCAANTRYQRTLK